VFKNLSNKNAMNNPNKNKYFNIIGILLIIVYIILYNIITNHSGGLLPNELYLPNDDISEFYVILNELQDKFMPLFIILIILYACFYKSMPNIKSTKVILIKILFGLTISFFFITLIGMFFYMTSIVPNSVIIGIIYLFSIMFLKIKIISFLFLLIAVIPIIYSLYQLNIKKI